MYLRVSSISFRNRSVASSIPKRQYARNAVVTILNEHEKLLTMTKSIRDGKVSDKRSAMDELIKQMFTHAALEDQVIYPTYKTLSGKQEISRVAMRADDSIRVRLTLLGTMRPDHPDWDIQLHELYDDLYHHISESEKNVLPVINERLAPDDKAIMQDILDELKKKDPRDSAKMVEMKNGVPKESPVSKWIKKLTQDLQQNQYYRNQNANANPNAPQVVS